MSMFINKFKKIFLATAFTLALGNVFADGEPEKNAETQSKESAKAVWVPGRNLVFTAIGCSFAESIGASKIIVGWDLEEANTFPDNSKEFLNRYNELIEIGSPDEIEIVAPLINLNKDEIVKLGAKNNCPMDLTYSCYEGRDIHCGICESCMRRKRGFKKAGMDDLTKYESD